jgi:hypothetical protein
VEVCGTKAARSGTPLAKLARVLRRSPCLLLAALAACVSSTPAPDDDAASCRVRNTAQQSAPALELDLVIAISDAPAMARYRDAVRAGLARLAAQLTASRVGLHVAVVGGDPGDVGAYLVDLDVPWFLCSGDCRTRNYAGSLGDALLRLGDVAPEGAPAPPLLARIEHALAGGDGFLAPGGYLGVLVVAAEDDGSPGDAAGYAERVLGLVPPGRAHVSVIAGAATPRLDRLLPDDVLQRDRAAIDGDWSDALHFERLFRTKLGLPCLSADVDPGACVASDSYGPIPPCVMTAPDRPDPATPLPCFRIAREALCASGLQPVVERAKHAGWYGAYTDCTCRNAPRFATSIRR